MVLINAFKVFSWASMAFVKNGGKKGGSVKRQADNHETLYHFKGGVPSTNSSTEKLILEYQCFGTGVSKA